MCASWLGGCSASYTSRERERAATARRLWLGKRPRPPGRHQVAVAAHGTRRGAARLTTGLGVHACTATAVAVAVAVAPAVARRVPRTCRCRTTARRCCAWCVCTWWPRPRCRPPPASPTRGTAGVCTRPRRTWGQPSCACALGRGARGAWEVCAGATNWRKGPQRSPDEKVRARHRHCQPRSGWSFVCFIKKYKQLARLPPQGASFRPRDHGV